MTATALTRWIRARWPRTTWRRVFASGFSAFCVEAGDGPDFVVLASPLVRARTYLPLLRQLARHFRVTVVELPGSGRASRVARPWTSSDYADWTAELLPALGVTRPWLMGHSDTGAAALLLGARHPERVSGLVLTGSVGGRLRRSVPRVVLGRILDGLQEPLLSLRASWHLLFNVLVHPRNLLHRIWECCTIDLLDCAAQVPVPSLLAWGRRDCAMPVGCAFRFEARMPRARVHIDPGAHDWPITRPAAFAKAALAFTAAEAQSRLPGAPPLQHTAMSDGGRAASGGTIMNEIVERGLKTGAALAVATTGTIMLASSVESGSPWAGVNAMATGFGVGGRRVRDGFALKVTPAGFVFLTGGLVAMGMAYEASVAAAGRRSNLFTGALLGIAGFVLDRFLLAAPLVPNFRRKMGIVGTAAKYLSVVLTSAMSSRWNPPAGMYLSGTGSVSEERAEARNDSASIAL
ncbi:alpha/beta fold hydrolase [Polyangium aurulentum]|uniref:alpha/beta fold hydrolase n=1 Tax=Polyangium aurulentum TaxID=2567896 RepID=UPI00146E1C75|nr:alpha/beta hydrolase [Polyangium aurulentum]UQA54669.1 alpha/beta hydrolase [Polyangium aurulentum]